MVIDSKNPSSRDAVVKLEKEHLVDTEFRQKNFKDYQNCILKSTTWTQGSTDLDIPSNYLGKLLIYETTDKDAIIPRAFVRIYQRLTYKNGSHSLWARYIYPHMTSSFIMPIPKNPCDFRIRLATEQEFCNLRDMGLILYSGHICIGSQLHIEESFSQVKCDC
jgi:hypothetical protein